MRRALWLLPLAAIVWLAYKIHERRTAPPEVRFVTAVREQLVSTLITNGKVEPLEWATVRAGREGALITLNLEKGKRIRKGDVAAGIDTAAAHTDLAAAEARVAQIQSDIEALRQGGRARELAEISVSTEAAKLELAEARREAESLQRLVERKAATPYELERARERIARAEASLAGWTKRTEALVSQPDLDAADARLREAQAAVTQAKQAIALGVVRAPLSGVVYQLDVQKGAWVRPGDALAEIGMLERVRVRVFVDEPELGGVRAGLPVSITWDAAPGRQWNGTVERLPAGITAVGSRQVGEVICLLDNPDATLIPGTNVTAEIRLDVVDNAITIPKETLRRENGELGIYLIEADRILWRQVRTGVASITKVQVLEGLKAGDRALLPTDTPLSSGMTVRAAPAN